MTVAISTVLHYNTNDDSTLYDIKHPPEGKHHAIIKITGKKDKRSYNCSAFVVSDDRAITAGHCVTVTEEFIEDEYPTLLKHSYEIEFKANEEIDGSKYCLTLKCKQRIAYLKNKLAEEIKLRKILSTPQKVKVYNIYGEDTGIEATAVMRMNRNANGDIVRDHAAIRGNFKDFEKIPIRRGFHIKRGDKLRSCGFAGGMKPPICIDWTAIGSYDFMYASEGYVVRGMSGGPVIDEHGFAVGINSYVDEDRVYMGTLVGVFDSKFERPKKKAKPIIIRAKNR